MAIQRPRGKRDSVSRLPGLAPSKGQRTLADRAFASIHDSIVQGTLEPGQRLPIEDLAASLEMSPMPVREALRRLDAVGLVEHVPHRGARVTVLSVEDLVDVYQARLALEPLAARRAADGMTTEMADEASEALSALKRVSRRGPDLWSAHTAFHFAVYRGADSHWLVRLIGPLWESSERYRMAIASRGELDVRPEEHEEILEAVLARNAARAGALMHNHLATTANFLAHKMGSTDVFSLMKVPKGRPRKVGAT
jgi:DNA-binding GntR family transcriptional regulator